LLTNQESRSAFIVSESPTEDDHVDPRLKPLDPVDPDALVEQLRAGDWQSWPPVEPLPWLASVILDALEAHQQARGLIPQHNWADCLAVAQAILDDGWGRPE
jgi:hypothetical protein